MDEVLCVLEDSLKEESSSSVIWMERVLLQEFYGCFCCELVADVTHASNTF